MNDLGVRLPAADELERRAGCQRPGLEAGNDAAARGRQCRDDVRRVSAVGHDPGQGVVLRVHTELERAAAFAGDEGGRQLADADGDVEVEPGEAGGDERTRLELWNAVSGVAWI